MNLMGRLVLQAAQVSEHPVYRTEARIRERRGWRGLTPRYAMILFGLIVAGTVILWGVLTVLRLKDNSSIRQFVSDEEIIYQASSQILGWMAFVSIIVAFVLDFNCMIASVTLINREMSSGHWNLLRLTNLKPVRIITAKHVIAQERPWRIMAFILSLRTAVILLLFARSLLLVDPYYGGSRTDLQIFLRDLEQEPLVALAGLALLLVILAIYLIEPLWRMRTVTAVGVMISARVGSASRAVLGGLGWIGFMWLSQIALSVLYFWLLARLLGNLDPASDLVGWGLGLLIIIIYALCIFAYYRLAQQTALGLAYRFAFLRET